jgi:fructan beta-fructosidase
MQSELFFGFNMSDHKADTIGISFENSNNERFIIGYSVVRKEFYIDRRNSGKSDFSKEFPGISSAPYASGNTLKLHLFVDASSVELFVDDGSLVMTSLVFPEEKFNSLKVFSRGGDGLLNKALFYSMESVWK